MNNDNDNTTPFDNANGNWVKINRSISTGSFYGRSDLQVLCLQLILNAEWKTHKRGVKTYRRGTYYYGLNRLSDILGFSPKRVKRLVDELISLRVIEAQKIRQKNTFQYVITICNYEKYQGGYGQTDVGIDVDMDDGSTAVCPSYKNKEEKKKKIRSIGGGYKANLAPPEKKVWDSYTEKIKEAYGTTPILNELQKNQVKALVKEIGDEASELVKYYVGIPRPHYVSHGHTLDICVQDLQKIKFAWVSSGRQR